MTVVVTDGVHVPLTVRLGEAVDCAVSEGDPAALGVPVSELVGVLLPVELCVTVGVCVTVPVPVSVCVAV